MFVPHNVHVPVHACIPLTPTTKKPVGDVVRLLTYLFSGPGIVVKNLLT